MRRQRRDLELPPKILVLRLSSLGDVVLSSSFLRSLSAEFPQAHIDFVVRDDLAAVATALPGVDNVIAVPRGASLAQLLRRARSLSAAGYEHVFDLHQSVRSRLLTWRLQRQLRRGFDKQSLARWLLLHAHRDVYDAVGGARTLRQRMLRPLQRMGLSAQLLPTQLRVPEELVQRAGEQLDAAAGAARSWVAVAPGALWPSKQWLPERFLAVAQQLLHSDERAVLLVGGERERGLCGTIAAALPERCLDVSGRTTILESAAFLQHCDLAITNDSGLLHVAEAVGCAVVALFGPTSPRFGYAPSLPKSRLLYRPPGCSPCSKNGSRPCQRPTHECMLALGVAEVVAACESVSRDNPRQSE